MDKHWRLPIAQPHNLAASAGRITFVGGAGDFDFQGRIRNPDLAGQIQGALENAESVLFSELCSLEDVVKVKVFYTAQESESESEWRVVAAVTNAFESLLLPAISTVPVPMQPFEGQRAQIQVIAQRGWRSLSDIRVHTEPVPEQYNDLFRHRELTSVLRAGEFITVANRTAAWPGTRLNAETSAVDQSHDIMDSMDAALATVGASLQDSVKMEGYYFGTNRDHWRPLAQARASYFAEPGPVATVVPCHRLQPDGASTKIEVIAMREKRASFDKYITREEHWPARVWDWPINLPYRQAIKLRDMIWLGGQVPSEPYTNTGKRVYPYDLERQTTFTMSYIEDLLRCWNRVPSDMKLAVCYFTSDGSVNQSEYMAELLAKCMGGTLPPLTLVPQPHMHTPESMVEIWGVAEG